MKNEKTIMTKEVRLGFVNLEEPKAIEDSTEAYYSVCAIIDKNDKVTIERIKEGIQSAIEEGQKTKWNGKKPSNLQLPLLDGDERKADNPNYKNKYYINAKNKYKPHIIDVYRNNITDLSQVYSGCYAQVALLFYPYENKGNSGVGVSLRAVVKRKDGDRIGGSTLDINALEIDPIDEIQEDDLPF